MCTHIRASVWFLVVGTLALACAACGENRPTSNQTRCREVSVGPSSLRRLTSSQYRNSVRDLFGVTLGAALDFSADERVGPFKSNAAAPIVELQADEYMAAAESVAAQVAGRLEMLLPCDRALAGEAACAQRFIARWVPRAFRRPLRTDETRRLLGLYESGKATAGFETGIRWVVEAVLQSPYFLYHHELEGSGSAGLSDHELAARLSYFLWDTLPDDRLWSAADTGELATETGLNSQLDRMLADPRAREGVANFHLQWLAVDQLETVEKSPDVYPGFTPRLAAAMKEETATFASNVVLDGDGTLATLLGADFTFTENPELQALYALTSPPDYVPGAALTLPLGQRAGLLTQASTLTRHAHGNQTSPVLRGKLLRENLLCQTLPPPPPGVDTTPPDPDPLATTRQRFEEHRADPNCAACHSLMDGLGFAFEAYDGIGAWRATDGSNPVDASGWAVGTDFDGTFTGAVELARRMVASQSVARCVTRQWFRFALGRAESEDDEETLAAVDAAFAESGYDVRALIRQLARSDGFLCRRSAEEDP